MASTQSYPAESAAAAAVDFGRDVGVSARSLGRQVLRSSPFTYLTSLLMPRRSRRYFWAWYVYIRWVDDFVDEGLKPQNERTAFVDRQVDLIRASKGRLPILYKEEQLLDAVLAYDTARGGMLRTALLDLLSSIRFDGQRVGEPADHATLHSHHEREVVSWLYTIAYFCEVPAKIQSPPGAQAAIGAKTAHVIRDFLRDCEERLFNVSRQEIAAYGLNLRDLTDDCAALPMRRWVAAKVRMAGRQLEIGLHDAASCGSLRYRLIVAVLIAKYQAYLDRFRGDRFVLKPHTPLHLGYFLKRLAANVGTVAGPKRRSPPPAAGIRPFDNLTPTSAVGRLALRLRLLPSRNRAIVRSIHDCLGDGKRSDDELTTITRRFVVAYWIGRESFAGVDGEPHPADASLSHLAGLVYAHWAIAVMEFDSLIDDHDLPPAAATALAGAWLGQISEAICQGKSDDGGQPGAAASPPVSRRFQRLAHALNRCLAEFSARALDARRRVDAEQEFVREARACLGSQIESRLQKALDPPHDWGWYLDAMLNQKTIGFALAPYSLWCRRPTADERKRRLDGAVRRLNAAYFHWQLLDDVADIDGDTRHGVVTGPGFILLSQGGIARRYLEVENAQAGAAGSAVIAAEVNRSRLLCERFAASPLCDRHRQFFPADGAASPAPAKQLVRCALANCEGDLDLPLAELCTARDRQAQGYLAAMQSRDWSAAQRHLAASGASVRIMLAAQEDAARETARTELQRVDDRFLLKTLDIIEMLTKHCGGKARRLVMQG